MIKMKCCFPVLHTFRHKVDSNRADLIHFKAFDYYPFKAFDYYYSSGW